jgi:hypothetical protein
VNEKLKPTQDKRDPIAQFINRAAILFAAFSVLALTASVRLAESGPQILNVVNIVTNIVH